MTHENLNTLVNLLNNYNVDDAKQSGKYQVDYDVDTFPYEGHIEFSVIVRFDKILPSPLMMTLTEFVWTSNEEIDWFLGSNKVHIQ